MVKEASVLAYIHKMSSGLNHKFQQVSRDLDACVQFGYSHCCKQHLLKKPICDSIGLDAKTIHRAHLGNPRLPAIFQLQGHKGKDHTWCRSPSASSRNFTDKYFSEVKEANIIFLTAEDYQVAYKMKSPQKQQQVGIHMVAPHTDSQPQYHHQSTSGCQRKLFAATPARGAEERITNPPLAANAGAQRNTLGKPSEASSAAFHNSSTTRISSLKTDLEHCSHISLPHSCLGNSASGPCENETRRHFRQASEACKDKHEMDLHSSGNILSTLQLRPPRTQTGSRASLEKAKDVIPPRTNQTVSTKSSVLELLSIAVSHGSGETVKAEQPSKYFWKQKFSKPPDMTARSSHVAYLWKCQRIISQDKHGVKVYASQRWVDHLARDYNLHHPKVFLEEHPASCSGVERTFVYFHNVLLWTVSDLPKLQKNGFLFMYKRESSKVDSSAKQTLNLKTEDLGPKRIIFRRPKCIISSDSIDFILSVKRMDTLEIRINLLSPIFKPSVNTTEGYRNRHRNTAFSAAAPEGLQSKYLTIDIAGRRNLPIHNFKKMTSSELLLFERLCFTTTCHISFISDHLAPRGSHCPEVWKPQNVTEK
ncbi:hypothetical protein Anapl_07282 [Anas platyrhynchos]|uniref:Uncharacterized protein n=1 Tax=Anas platyrhynchos TaxID=8839 RepID=R0L0Z5_ANAPL|nr:hypothetical protein Anapl_07282 [Anas platyrhynchos]